MTSNDRVPILGLIINPIAGLGGRVGLKGSDGLETQQQALRLGGKGRGVDRALQALRVLRDQSGDRFRILTCQGVMGDAVVRQANLQSDQLLPAATQQITKAEDTVTAARWMADSDVDLILFSGGDGTARNILDALNESGKNIPVLGIPAGVKVQSAVFAINPLSAGETTARFLNGQIKNRVRSEVMDLDEEELRQERVSAQLYGHLDVPDDRRMIQCAKARSGQSDRSAACAIADEVADGMKADTLYIIGPGMTTSALKQKLNISGSLIGVDLVKNGELVYQDASEKDILNALDQHTGSCQLVITCIGGQGFILGRGNPQISPAVLNRIGTGRITVLATSNKLNSLGGRPLLVDTGSPGLDKLLSGYISVVTGFKQRLVYKIASSL